MYRKLLLLVVVVVVWLLNVAATAQDDAARIAGFVVVAAPIILPFILKKFPFVDNWMVAITAGIAFVIALGCGLAAHLFSFSDFGTLAGLLVAVPAVYGLMQFVYNILSQSPSLKKYVH